MQKEKPNRQNKSSKEGYVIMPNNFLTEWIKVLGKGPILLYLQMLTYCHKEKDIAWPALSTLGDSLDMSKNSLISYQKTLLKHDLIKKTVGRRSARGNYRSNLYKVTPIRSPRIGPSQVQKLDMESSKFALDQVQKLHPNNTNLNSINITTTNKEKDAVVAAANFKKLKEKGEERMRVIRERMVELDFKEGFVEKIVKEYSTKRIEEKLDLLMERRNIKSPAGWLMAALKNDYRGEESSLSFPRKRESIKPNEEPSDESDHLKCRGTMHRALNESGQIDNKKILSTEEARERFHFLKEKLMAMNSP